MQCQWQVIMHLGSCRLLEREGCLELPPERTGRRPSKDLSGPPLCLLGRQHVVVLAQRRGDSQVNDAQCQARLFDTEDRQSIMGGWFTADCWPAPVQQHRNGEVGVTGSWAERGAPGLAG